ncbi:sodium/glutamate symporter [Microbacterium sp. MPKO10]|uniref:sodium/glutamate symporter n=1 Tax=Microbacterium sp. MPKO10 TaxID=2989818 RepID=UPI00223571AE|nr:sodium/glutamate symporter [Microbacterium sp. MPKO10]MCW4459944.1 sodium/glutamate symporter [Microbacterium sp. MPKO10]
MNLELDLVQTSALAILLLLLGEAACAHIGFLRRFSIPGPVVGGFAFALVVLALRQTGAATIELDTTLQSPVMVMFFTTIGLAGSFALIKKGGKLLLIYVAACWGLAIAQNLIGIGMALVVGIDPLLGIMAGAVSLEGGHGAAAAFGPTAESLGADGAAAVAIASATFGLVAGSLLGGPVAVGLMKRHRVAVPSHTDSSVESVGETRDEASYKQVIPTLAVIGVIVVLGLLLGDWFSEVTGFVLPGYVGAMLVAVIARNVNDKVKAFRMHDGAVELVSRVSLGFFLTMAMMSLKIWDLFALALPLIAILAVQLVFILAFVWFVLFRILGRSYDAVTMVAAMLGHGLGATPNAIANMDAFNARFGVRSTRAFLIVPLAGAMLIDIVALPWIVFCLNWVSSAF